MLDHPTPLVATILRRALSVAMAALMLLSVAISAEAGASHANGPVGQAEFVLSNGHCGDDPADPDSLPCHAAHHLCGKVVPMPPALVTEADAVTHPESSLDWMPVRTLVSGLTELPPRPPRA